MRPRERPTLPSQAKDPAARTTAIERARDAYAYDWSYGRLCFVKDLPFSEMFPPRYLARGAEVTIRLSANRAASEVSGWLREHLEKPAAERSLDGWAKMFATLPAPR